MNTITLTVTQLIRDISEYLENLNKMKQKKLTLNIFRYFNYMVNLYGKLTRYLETVTLQNKSISCTQVHFPVSTRRVLVIRLGNLRNIAIYSELENHAY